MTSFNLSSTWACYIDHMQCRVESTPVLMSDDYLQNQYKYKLVFATINFLQLFKQTKLINNVTMTDCLL